jgi:small subunit ribosomal protein S15
MATCNFIEFMLRYRGMLNTKKKQTIIKKTQIHDKDTGSPEVQVAVLSAQIDALAKHLKKNKKDNHSRRGLIKMVADRRTHLKYLERKDKVRHAELVKKIDLL